jgi:hypothetical protein
MVTRSQPQRRVRSFASQFGCVRRCGLRHRRISHSEKNIDRESVYTRYLVERLNGSTVERAKLTRFRLEQMSRPHRGASRPPSGVAQRVVPDAVLEGFLKVSDPELFLQTLKSGVGRQRAFGRGYVRLEPLRVSAAA